jgi:signal transduction histidine kinase
MWRELLNGPWPDEGDLPGVVQQQARQRIRRYWRGRIWLQIILGEAVLWIAAETQHVEHARSYSVPLILVSVGYVLGVIPNVDLIWMIGLVVVFAIQGMLIKGLGGVTAISFMLPYTFSTMMVSGRRRVLVQAVCVVGFWFSLLYEFSPIAKQLEPPRYLVASYGILMAAATFQGLRFLNRLAIELNTIHVAQEVTERSQQFLARVSHELRTPLNSVLGFAKMLRRADLPPTQAGYLTQIVEEGEQLNRLVSDLLDSAQLSAGKLILKVDTCDVNSICAAVAEEIRSILKPTVALRMALNPDVPTIRADGLRLRQVIRNLVGNAAKYTPHGEIAIRTALRTGQNGSSVVIEVSDTGPGIPADQQALVFVPFVKLDGRSAGVGLGLDIARQLAVLHGGDIYLESVVGHGSTFTLEIPVQSG